MLTKADSKVSRLIGGAFLFGTILFTGLLIYAEVVGWGKKCRRRSIFAIARRSDANRRTEGR